MSKRNQEPDVSGTFAGINTPHDQEGQAATDIISEFVQQVVDNIQHEFDEEPDDGKSDNDLPNK